MIAFAMLTRMQIETLADRLGVFALHPRGLRLQDSRAFGRVG
jgi:hypothetical protein